VTATMIRTSPIRDVDFVCPHCGVDREGSVVELHRWIGVGRLPLVPMRRLGPMVECRACAHHSGVGVLNIPTTKALDELLRNALRYSIVSVVRAGRGVGPGNDDVERHAVSIMRNAGYVYDRFDLDDDLRDLSESGTVSHVRPLAEELTPHGKQSLLHKLHTLATLDGAMRPSQRDALLRIGLALGMGAAHINGVIAVGADIAGD
jgi:hypothetical protein